MFEELINEIPFNPTTVSGKGFLPNLYRAGGHILYLVGRLSDTPTRPTDNQIREELDSLNLHWADFAPPSYLSEGAHSAIRAFREAYDAMDLEIADMDYDTKVASIRSISNRLAQLMVILDRELLGIRDSDAGQSL